MMVAHAREEFGISHKLDPKRIYAYSRAEFYAHRGRSARDALALATGGRRRGRASDKTAFVDGVLDESSQLGMAPDGHGLLPGELYPEGGHAWAD